MRNLFKHTQIITVLLTLAGAASFSLPAEARDDHRDHRGYDRHDNGNHYGHRNVSRRVVVVPSYQTYGYYAPQSAYYYPATYYQPYRPTTVFSFRF